MKKIFIMLLVTIVTSDYVFSQTQQVSSREAEDAASNWIGAHYPECLSRGSVVSMLNQGGHTLLYEIRFDSINVLLSGSKACLPVLGYYKGEMSIVNNMDNLPCNLRSFIDSFIEEIEYCFANDTITLYHDDDWMNLIEAKSMREGRSTEVVSPLIKTQWNQSSSNDGLDLIAYNYLIPPDDDYHCLHQLVGCGAVALAQVMNYWQYPVLYKAPKQFDWCNMTNILDRGNDNDYFVHRDAIAYLMYRCAEDIDSEYGCDGTSSKMIKIRKALVDVYGYNSNAQIIKKTGFIGDWEGLVKSSLDSEHPVIYSGFGTGGHAFVCDGYRDDGTFHFNWGWAGKFDSCYFVLGSLTPGTDDYSSSQAAIFFIKPLTSNDICSTNLHLDDFYHDYSALLSDYHPYEITPQTMTTLTSASVTSDSSWRTIPANVSAVYQAHEEIILQNGFEAKYGSEFEARIEPCVLCDENRGNNAEYMAANRYPYGIGEEDSNFTDEETAYALPHPQKNATEDLFPNPTDGPLTMATDGMAEAVFVHDMTGHIVGGWHLDALTETSVTLDVSALRSGPYLLTVTTSSGTCTARFLRK